MRQRVCLARGFVTEPDLLLLDEPFAFLDYQTRLELQSLLLDIWRQKQTTVLFVTHDIDEALLLAQNIIIFSSRPANLIAQLVVPFDYPRRLLDIREDSRFLPLYQDITRLLTQNKRLLVSPT